MLILNRKAGESIIIGDNVEISILEIQEGRIKIGIEAPKDVSILRKEVYDSVVEANQEAISNDQDIFKVLSNK